MSLSHRPPQVGKEKQFSAQHPVTCVVFQARSPVALALALRYLLPTANDDTARITPRLCLPGTRCRKSGNAWRVEHWHVSNDTKSSSPKRPVYKAQWAAPVNFASILIATNLSILLNLTQSRPISLVRNSRHPPTQIPASFPAAEADASSCVVAEVATHTRTHFG